MKPNKANACSGRYSDWLEVNLTPACNASCKWCVERRGWHPETQATWQEIVSAALATGATNVILLGGEPTLHPNLREIISALSADVRVWMTTNGSRLSKQFACENLVGIHGVNVSIHSDCLDENRQITGLRLLDADLREAVSELVLNGVSVRFNCNCIRGYIDSQVRALRYIDWAGSVGATSVRFAELKFDNDRFVDLASLFPGEYGLNQDPFLLGCSSDAVINGMPVNFRQMCGLQTTIRPCPQNPEFGAPGGVLYYDGNVYAGWQVQREVEMTEQELAKLLQDVADGKVKPKDAEERIAKDVMLSETSEVRAKPAQGGYCIY